MVDQVSEDRDVTARIVQSIEQAIARAQSASVQVSVQGPNDGRVTLGTDGSPGEGRGGQTEIHAVDAIEDPRDGSRITVANNTLSPQAVTQFAANVRAPSDDTAAVDNPELDQLRRYARAGDDAVNNDDPEPDTGPSLG